MVFSARGLFIGKRVRIPQPDEVPVLKTTNVCGASGKNVRNSGAAVNMKPALHLHFRGYWKYRQISQACLL